MSKPQFIHADTLFFVMGALFGAMAYWGLFFQGGEISFWGDEIIFFLKSNLGFSLLGFLSVMAAYGYFIHQLKIGLAQDRLCVLETKQLLTRIHTLSGLFFGIGVLWTAIGMRSALLSALGDLDENSAAQIGAFEILRRLVDGGILVALSTTIVGGFGGYLMKLIETFYVSADVQAYFDREEANKQEILLKRMSRVKHVDEN